MEGALAPRGPGGVTYELWSWSLAVSPFSEKKKAAWLFSSGPPARRSRSRFICGASPCRANPCGWTGVEVQGAAQYYEAAVTQVQNARPSGTRPAWPRLRSRTSSGSPSTTPWR